MTRTNDRPAAMLSRLRILLSLLLLSLAMPPTMAGAQDTATDFDPHPLRPADTSSPRDTLRSFLTNVNEVIKDRRRGPDARSAAGFGAHDRALQTLDLSTTPDGDATVVQTERSLFLKEILDRIELPPEDEIPGDAEVADGGITQWTIPDTRITIRRIEHGPRGGEFLFSADTVQRLDRLYRQAKHLPYKPGATVGAYEEFIRSKGRERFREQQVRNRLRPVDVSSPRSTLEGFLDSVNRAYALIMEAEAALKATPPAITQEQAREIEIKAGHLLQRAAATLDLSQVPETLREDVGIETTIQLKEILDRMVLPRLASVPNAHMVEAARERGSRSPFQWRYPNTAIEIVEIMEGERQGQFLFSAGSVNRIGDYYRAVREIPYRRDDYGALDDQHRSPGKSEGFYEFYASTPGYLIPHASFLAGWLEVLPDWLKTMHRGATY